MPLQSNDIATQMGDLIASNMGDTALTFRNNAPNDKTYVVTILGVGQDFTDDIAQAEQESIVKKYNIPAVPNDDTIYYTFKLEGIYYSVRQNGNFKLYEQTLLRVPNNNWDRMFLERLGESGDTVAESNGSHIFTDIQEPPLSSAEGTAFSEDNKLIQQGDTYIYWVVASNIGNYRELYIPVQGEDNLYYWEKVNMVCASEAPQINSKDVSESGGKYYWIEIKDEKIKGIYKSKKSVSETNVLKYVWDIGKHWSYNKEFEDYSITREYALPTRYSGTIAGYQSDMYNPCIYLSNSAPVQLGDIWYKINDFVSCELMQICEHKVGITGKQCWQIVCNIAGNGEGEYYHGHNIIVSDVEPEPIPDVEIPDEYKHSRPDRGATDEIYTTCTLKTVGNKLTINFIQVYMFHPSFNPLEDGEWERKDFFVYYPDKYLNYEEKEKLIIPDENDMSRVGKIAIIVACDYDFFDPGYRNIDVYEYVKRDNKWGRDMLGVFPSRGKPLTERAIEYVGSGTSINDGDYWAKVNNMTDKKLMSFHECVGGKWQLLYTAYTPTIYALTTDPTTINDANNNPIYNVQVGDYWAKTDGDSSKNITEFYQRVSTVDEQTQQAVESWDKLFSCSGGGGGQTINITIQNAIIVDKTDVIENEVIDTDD